MPVPGVSTLGTKSCLTNLSRALAARQNLDFAWCFPSAFSFITTTHLTSFSLLGSSGCRRRRLCLVNSHGPFSCSPRLEQSGSRRTVRSTIANHRILLLALSQFAASSGVIDNTSPAFETRLADLPCKDPTFLFFDSILHLYEIGIDIPTTSSPGDRLLLIIAQRKPAVHNP